MKKSFFLSILAVGALVACSKSEVVETSFDNAIKFENYVGRDAQTKASIVEKADIPSVLVNAWLHDVTPAEGTTPTFTANFMSNQVVNIDGTYSPAKYWPNELQAIDFVAWVDTNIAEEGDGANLSVENALLTFKVPTDVTKQTELIVANPQLNMNGEIVELNFKHLLSRIGFQINVSGLPADGDANNKIEITKVVLNGDFASAGTVDMTAKTPAVAGDVAEASYTLTGVNFKDENGAVLTSNVLTNGTYNNADNSYIMLIPAENEPANITVEYTITTAAQTEGGQPTVITNTTVFPLTDAYAVGYAYKYIFDITMDAIEFKVEVDEWIPTDDVNITPEEEEETPAPDPAE